MIITDTTKELNDCSRMRDPLECLCDEVDCLIVCYSTVDRESFKDACEGWPEHFARRTKKNVPKILVGTKTDLR